MDGLALRHDMVTSPRLASEQMGDASQTNTLLHVHFRFRPQTSTTPTMPSDASSVPSVGKSGELQTRSSPLRPHVDDTVLPYSEYFTTLAELDDWWELRHAEPVHASRVSTATRQPRATTSSSSPAEPEPEPKLLVCHDYAGGYTEDPVARGYTFEHWRRADVLVYFAHHRVSVPPLAWVRAARCNNPGMAVLGTLIFEWEAAIPDLAQLLRGPEAERKVLVEPGPRAPTFSTHYADLLVELARERGIQGWLVNVETALELGFALSAEPWPSWVREPARHAEMRRNAHRLRGWLDYLRARGEALIGPQWRVVWYDSVTFPHGKLAWQDALTPSNAPFFDAAHAIFTNYTWARPPLKSDEVPPGIELPPHMQAQAAGAGLTGPSDGGYHPALTTSAAHAASRRADVYVGIDVFGRNCFGGFHVARSLDMIRPLRLSTALFAPGWTWEHDTPPTWREWYDRDTRFWSVFPQPKSQTHKCRRWYTNFSPGSGDAWFVDGQRVLQQPWTDVAVTSPRLDLGRLCDTDAWAGPVSLRVDGPLDFDIPLDQGQEYIVDVVIKGQAAEADPLPNGWARLTTRTRGPHIHIPTPPGTLVGAIHVYPASETESGTLAPPVEAKFDRDTGVLTWPADTAAYTILAQVFVDAKWVGTATREIEQTEFVMLPPRPDAEIQVRCISGRVIAQCKA